MSESSTLPPHAEESRQETTVTTNGRRIQSVGPTNKTQQILRIETFLSITSPELNERGGIKILLWLNINGK